MYRTYRNILVQRKFRYSERAKRGLNEAVEWEESKTIYDNECPIYRQKLKGKNKKHHEKGSQEILTN